MLTARRVSFLIVAVLSSTTSSLLAAGSTGVISKTDQAAGRALIHAAAPQSLPSAANGSTSTPTNSPMGNMPRPPLGSGHIAANSPMGNMPRPPLGSGKLHVDQPGAEAPWA